MLTLEIDHLLGVAFAARGQDSDEPDWPPQPDRIFSALVAAWGERGEQPTEREALEWLEVLPPPQISASAARARAAPTTFVPPNDAESGRVGNKEVAPAFRRRQPRRFPAALPDDPRVQLFWEAAEPPIEILDALNALARDTSYVGHSASLTRCRFIPAVEAPQPLRPARRRIYPGRLAELERVYAAGDRPSPGDWVKPQHPAGLTQPQSTFSPEWLVFEITKGDADLRAAAALGKLLLRSVMSGYGRIGLKDAIPAAVSGHEVDGAPAVAAHLAVVPLANLGWTYSDGALFGFALVPPRAEPGRGLLEDPNFQRAIRAVLLDGVLPLNGTGVELKPIVEAARASLDPLRYRGPARTWATATPIVVDRHLKTDPAKDGPEARQEEIADVIARACTNIGLPPPAVVPDKHSAIEGAPSAYPSGRAPAWTGWRVPEPQRSRALSHAVIWFAEPVEGPVILGSGRFSGLGICLPLDAEARR